MQLVKIIKLVLFTQKFTINKKRFILQILIFRFQSALISFLSDNSNWKYIGYHCMISS